MRRFLHAVQRVRVGEHTAEAFACCGEIELADGLDCVGPFARVAAVEHGFSGIVAALRHDSASPQFESWLEGLVYFF